MKLCLGKEIRSVRKCCAGEAALLQAIDVVSQRANSPMILLSGTKSSAQTLVHGDRSTQTALTPQSSRPAARELKSLKRAAQRIQQVSDLLYRAKTAQAFPGQIPVHQIQWLQECHPYREGAYRHSEM